MSVFIFSGIPEEDVPRRLYSSRSWLHKHCSRMELSSREDRSHGIFRNVSPWDDISSRCLRQRGNRVNSNKKTTRYRDEFIPGRTESSRGENSHVKGNNTMNRMQKPAVKHQSPASSIKMITTAPPRVLLVTVIVNISRKCATYLQLTNTV